MNPDIQKINSIITSTKLANQELETLNEKEKELDLKLKKSEEEYEASKKHFDKISKDVELLDQDEELKKLEEEYQLKLEESKPYEIETKLCKDIDTLLANIEILENEIKGYNEDIQLIKDGTYDPILGQIEITENREKNQVLRKSIAQKVVIEKIGDDRLSVASIESILNACIEYYKDKYTLLVAKERRERRRILQNKAEWIEVSLRMLRISDYLTDKYQREMLEELGIDMEYFNEEVEIYCFEGNKYIITLMEMMPKKLKDLLGPSKKLNKENVLSIMAFQVGMILHDLPDLYKLMPKLGPENPDFSPDMMSMLINNRLADLTWDKFGTEEEDFAQAMKNQKINHMNYEMERALLSVMPNVETA